MKKFWDHSTKPSTWVVKEGGDEIFRGAFRDGVMYLKSLKSNGLISFKDDYLPAIKEATKRAYKSLMCERDLRREVFKLKKEIKILKGEK
jgi:hypothetical protein